PAVSLTCQRSAGIRSLVGIGNQHLAPCPPSALPPAARGTWLYLNTFRGEPAISTFGWHFTPIHKSSPSFATLVGASLDDLSQSLSSPFRGAFHLSLTVLVHYRSLKVLSLGGWSPQLPTNSPGFVVLRMPARLPSPVSTGLSPAVVGLSNPFKSAWLACVLVLQPQRFRKTPGLGSSRFARHYYGNLV